MANADDIDRRIIDVLDRFDFDRVHRVMLFLDWTWAGINAVPSPQEIRDSATARLLEAKNLSLENEGRRVECSSGGLVAVVEDGVVELSFRLQRVTVSS